MRERSGVRLGIHCQDDTSCAVANTLAAVEAGVTHVQCTANGYGERTGNADLFSVVASLELKLGIKALPEGNLRESKRISHALADITNLPPNTHQAYVGVSSFAHKAGLHASALKVNEELYSHIDPRLVGNDTRILVTEMAGRATVELKGRELGVDIASDPEALARVVETVKTRESQGWTYEAADASFELVMRDELPGEKRRYFDVESWRTIVSPQVNGDGHGSEAIVKVHAGGQRIVRVGRGQRPGQRAGQRAAHRAGADLPGGRRARAGRLQGPHRSRRQGHGRRHPGPDPDRRRRGQLVDGRACTRT